MNPYEERDRNLREMGFDSYGDYLTSNLWHGIRGQVLFHAKKRCAGCGRRATEIHHKNYSLATLRGETLSMLVALCRSCHTNIEHDTMGRKCNLQEANKKLLAITARNTNPEYVTAQRDPNRCPCGNMNRHKGQFCGRCRRMSPGKRFKLWRKLHESRLESERQNLETQLQHSATLKTPEGDPCASLERPEDCGNRYQGKSAPTQPG